MKRILPVIVSQIILLMACNNQSDSSQNKTPLPLAEQNLREEIIQYPDSFTLKEKLVQYF
jgi:uncharacterized lipoprotein YajG